MHEKAIQSAVVLLPSWTRVRVHLVEHILLYRAERTKASLGKTQTHHNVVTVLEQPVRPKGCQGQGASEETVGIFSVTLRSQ